MKKKYHNDSLFDHPSPCVALPHPQNVAHFDSKKIHTAWLHVILVLTVDHSFEKISFDFHPRQGERIQNQSLGH